MADARESSTSTGPSRRQVIGLAGGVSTAVWSADPRLLRNPRRLNVRRPNSPHGSSGRSFNALRSEFLRLAPNPGREWHVGGAGSPLGDGTARRPLREIHDAVLRAAPGDRVLVGPGEYGYTEVRGIHGAPDRWLTLVATGGPGSARISVPPPTDNFVNVIDSSFVGIFGFEVHGDQSNPNTNGSGISVYGGSHHVLVWANHVHDFPGGGINCFDVGGSHDLIDVSHNTIHATSRTSPQNTSGISLCASRDLTRGETLLGGWGCRITHNYVYDVECCVPFTPGGFDVVTDGNAVSIDSLLRHDYGKPVLVEDNVLVGSGGRAVHVFDSVDVDVTGNTVVGNVRSASPAIFGEPDLDGTTDASVRFIGNVICPLFTSATRDETSTYLDNVILGGQQTVASRDLDRREVGTRWFRGNVTTANLNSGLPVEAFIPRNL